MTDKNPEISPAAPTVVTATGAGSGSATSSGPNQTSTRKDTPTRKPGSVVLPAFVIALLLAVALGALVWYQYQQQLRSTALLQDQVKAASDTAGRGAEQARQALALAQEQGTKIAALEASLDDALEQAEGLQQAFQTLTDSGSDLVLVNDVDHLVTIAQQQLQLGGNVANAIISLETAQAQLARANRPALASLQQTINGDLNRLRAATTIDIASLSEQLDELGNLVSQAPLMVPDDAATEPVRTETDRTQTRPQGSTPSPQDADAAWWKQGFNTVRHWTQDAWTSVRTDLGQFIDVRRVDDPQALLMSPDQATRFRENLRLRIMTAQLALMMRQPKVWVTETTSLVKAIESRFDQQSPESRRALKIARDMSDTNIDSPMPTVDNSLAAIETLREASAKSAKNAPAAPGNQASDSQSAAPETSEPQATESPAAQPPASLPEASPPPVSDPQAAGTQPAAGASAASQGSEPRPPAHDSGAAPSTGDPAPAQKG